MAVSTPTTRWPRAPRSRETRPSPHPISRVRSRSLAAGRIESKNPSRKYQYASWPGARAHRTQFSASGSHSPSAIATAVGEAPRRHLLRNDHAPGVQHQLGHLVVTDGVEPHLDPVVAEVGRA